ncbi:MAG: TonB-dependent receptor, partial [Bacteroidales bacterium]|nr:TonB-dependent receptor [Bacteroidales bacterium]
GSDFSDNGNTTLGLGGLHKAKIQRLDFNTIKRTNIGYLGRFSYGYDGKYYFTASYRRDGASVFGARNKWGNFAAAGIAWRITEERFMEKFKPLNNLKLKFSWGQNGNQGISPYATLSQANNGSGAGNFYEFSDTGEKVYYGIIQTTLGNANLGWESTDALNTGFESAWLGSRLFVDVDFYHSQTRDQIFERVIPSMTGFSRIYASMGQVNNTGIDITVRSVNLQNKNLTWTTGLTFWKNNNKLVKLYGEDLDGDGKEDDDIASNLFIGKSLGAIYGYKQVGIVQEDDTEYIAAMGTLPGNPKYDDMVDGTPGLTPDDRTILGYQKENFRLNVSSTLRYRDFELYVMAVGIFGGNDRYLKSNPYAFRQSESDRNTIDEMTIFHRPYWTPENRNNTYPHVKFKNDGRFLGLQDRTWMRIQDISLSYMVNMPWVKSCNIRSLKIFLAAKNVAVFTNWFGTDPELGTGWMDGTYPVMASYSLGANFSF